MERYFTSSIWGIFSNSWCLSSTVCNVSSLISLCTLFAFFNFIPAKGACSSSAAETDFFLTMDVFWRQGEDRNGQEYISGV